MGLFLKSLARIATRRSSETDEAASSAEAQPDENAGLIPADAAPAELPPLLCDDNSALLKDVTLPETVAPQFNTAVDLLETLPLETLPPRANAPIANEPTQPPVSERVHSAAAVKQPAVDASPAVENSKPSQPPITQDPWWQLEELQKLVAADLANLTAINFDFPATNATPAAIVPTVAAPAALPSIPAPLSPAPLAESLSPPSPAANLMAQPPAAVVEKTPSQPAAAELEVVEEISDADEISDVEEIPDVEMKISSTPAEIQSLLGDAEPLSDLSALAVEAAELPAEPAPQPARNLPLPLGEGRGEGAIRSANSITAPAPQPVEKLPAKPASSQALPAQPVLPQPASTVEPKTWPAGTPTPAAMLPTAVAASPLNFRPEYRELRDQLLAQLNLTTHPTLLLVDAGRQPSDVTWLWPVAAGMVDKLNAARRHTQSRVLLVEAAGPQSGLSRSLGLDTHLGLNHVLNGRSHWPAVLQSTLHPQISLLARGAEYLQAAPAQRLQELWAELSQEFDLLIVAVGPTGQYPATANSLAATKNATDLFLPLASAAMLYVELGGTSTETAAHAKQLLDAHGIKVLGCIVQPN